MNAYRRACSLLYVEGSPWSGCQSSPFTLVVNSVTFAVGMSFFGVTLSILFDMFPVDDDASFFLQLWSLLVPAFIAGSLGAGIGYLLGAAEISYNLDREKRILEAVDIIYPGGIEKFGSLEGREAARWLKEKHNEIMRQRFLLLEEVKINRVG